MADDLEKSSYDVELPIDGSQDSEFAKMGIEFGPFDERDKWRGANLPSGWRIKNDRSSCFVLDQLGRPRAVFYRRNHIHMRPLRRFNYGRAESQNPDEFVKFCLWDAAVPDPNERKVVMEEERQVPSRKQQEDVHKNRSNTYYKEFEEKVKKWLNERYPNWESYSGHWDEE